MFCHLHLHTEYSLVDSVVRIQAEGGDAPGLMDAVVAAGMPSVALTDQSNLFAMVKFYRAAQSAGVKPIIGIDLRVRELGERQDPSTLVLLCQNDVGYRNLTRLVSRSYLEGQHRGVATIDRSWLSADNLVGLIALSGARDGDLGRAIVHGREEEACKAIESWLALFGDRYYIELQRTRREAEERYIHGALEMAADYGVPVVATNDVRFIRAEDYESHEARVCIHDGALVGDAKRRRRYSREQYLKSPREMTKLFEDVPEAVDNSFEIARRCNLELKLGKSVLPAYPVPGNLGTEDFLREEARRGLLERLEQLSKTVVQGRTIAREEYEERLASEISVICQMGFAGYFLIVADFIRWARENGVPVGPGRGSGAGSLVAYSLGITDLDPLRYDLLFERFLNPERVSMPDFDIDFCQDGRDRVIDYVRKKYGEDSVSQIATFGTMAARAVLRDTGRVLDLGYNFCDQIAKLVPVQPGKNITLRDAREMEPLLAQREKKEEEVRDLLELAEKLEGLTRNVGMHAGGVLIAPGKLTDYCPLYAAEGATHVISQLDKDDVEAVGLVKFDFLGLTTLTVLDWAERYVRERENKDFSIEA